MPGGGAPPRRGRRCVRGRRRRSLSHAGRGLDGLGRPRARADRGPERDDRGRRHPSLGRPPDVQLRVTGRGLARRHHARHPRPGPRAEHAEADPDPHRARRRAAALRTRPVRQRRRWGGPLQAPRLGHDRRVPRSGLPARCARQLPRAARLELRRQDDDHVPRGARRALLARARVEEPGRLRLREAHVDERRLSPGAAGEGVRGRPRRLAARAGLRLGRGARPARRAARAGEDRAALGVSRLRGLPLRARGAGRRPSSTAAASCLAAAADALSTVEPFTLEAIEAALRRLADERELKPRDAFQPIRIAVTGSKVSPGLFESIELLGRDEAVQRLRAVHE